MEFTKEQISKIKIESLAQKHNCSHSYVSLILSGQRETKTDLAKAIMADAKKILKIVTN